MARKEDLAGLKAYAESAMFQDLRVTPAMQERLLHRVRVAEKTRKPSRRWAWQGAVAAAAACVVLAVGLTMEPGTERNLATQSAERAPAPTAPPA
ncbi:MAG TPA: hypothetical protein VD902_07560, partial [Symbiobacteriaceae bacterium]|nr:hypothetical protein [Symbiobacteriaceae bacterium]